MSSINSVNIKHKHAGSELCTFSRRREEAVTEIQLLKGEMSQTSL